MLKSRSLAAALLVVTAAACGDTGAIGPDIEQDTELATLLASESGSLLTTPERGSGSSLFDRLAAEIPDFGGLYRSDKCAINVVLTDLTHAEQAVRIVKAAIQPLVARSCPNGIRVHPVQGQFTYVALQRYLAASRPLLQIRGVNGVSVNYQLNRLVISVAARAVVPEVVEALPRVGIPADAVTFQVSSGRSRG